MRALSLFAWMVWALGGLLAPKVLADSLFNGKNLSGWVVDVPKADDNKDIQPTFIIRDGKLVSLGNPRGHLITVKEYENYQLTVEYRFTRELGNGGVLLHVSKLRALEAMYPQSIEIQMKYNETGDFLCIGEKIEPSDKGKRQSHKKGEKRGVAKNDALRITALSNKAEKKLGEWNTMRIECQRGEIKVWLNGELVNHGFKSSATKGKIAIQADGAEVEYRKLDLQPIAKKTMGK